jgi:hypothetical protein
MKRILILLLALMPAMVGAQDFKPLESVEVPDFPTNEIRITESEYLGGGTYYTASYMLARRGMTASLGVPALFDIYMERLDIPEQTTAKVSIGGEEYFLSASLINNNSVYIDIKGLHVKHIAVSGVQSMVFLNNGDIVHTQDFNDIEQELWRRTADELAKTVDKFGILDF